MKCKHCGAEITDDSVFCEHCGTKVTKKDTTKKKFGKGFAVGCFVAILVLIALATVGWFVLKGYLGTDNIADIFEEFTDNPQEEQVSVEDTLVQIDSKTICMDTTLDNQEETNDGDIVERKVSVTPTASVKEDNRIYTYTTVDIAPQFPGGENALRSFIENNIKYPDAEQEKNYNGMALVSFVVEKNGKITNARVISDLGGGSGQEALRLVSIMPDWYPGYNGGKPVRVQYTLPIEFSFDVQKVIKATVNCWWENVSRVRIK